MHEGGAVHELDRDSGAQKPVGLRRGDIGGEEDEQRAQAFAPAEMVSPAQAGQNRAVVAHNLGHPLLEHARADARPELPDLERRPCERRGRVHTRHLPNVHRDDAAGRQDVADLAQTESHMMAASAAGAGKRRTELGR